MRYDKMQQLFFLAVYCHLVVNERVLQAHSKEHRNLVLAYVRDRSPGEAEMPAQRTQKQRRDPEDSSEAAETRRPDTGSRSTFLPVAITCTEERDGTEDCETRNQHGRIIPSLYKPEGGSGRTTILTKRHNDWRMVHDED